MTDRTEGTALPPFEAEFARVWNTPGHTRYHLPDTDINKVLAARYTTSAPLTLTRTMLWDMEVRKAAHPGTYIPYVVQAGTDRSWSRQSGDGGEYLDRCSMQRLWLVPHQYQLILERAFLNHRDRHPAHQEARVSLTLTTEHPVSGVSRTSTPSIGPPTISGGSAHRRSAALSHYPGDPAALATIEAFLPA